MRVFCFKQGEARCPGCGWRTAKFYVLAEDPGEARAVLERGEGLCGECMAELLSEEAYSITADKVEQRPIFTITSEEVQKIAKEVIGRELTEEELRRVKKGIEFGLECWEDVVRAAIEGVIVK